MGATTFMETAKKKDFKTAKDAFEHLVEDAAYMYGHDAYSGTIATKTEFVKSKHPHNCKTIKETLDLAEELLDTKYQNLSKWDSAVMLECEEGWVFFGWAPE